MKALDWLLNTIPKIPIRITRRAPTLIITPFSAGGWPHWSYGRDKRGPIALLAVKAHIRNASKQAVFLTTARAGVGFLRWWRPYSRSPLVPASLSHPDNPFVGLSSSRLGSEDTRVVAILATVRPAPRNSRHLLVRIIVSSDTGQRASRWIWLHGRGDPPKQREHHKASADEIKRREQVKEVALTRLEERCPGMAKTLDALVQAEADVYRSVGRGTGGLGTVALNYQGRTYPGIGTEWRTPGLPKQQFVIEDPASASITSENWDAVMRVFASLRDDDARERAANYLVSHMDGEGQFASVGYFLVGALRAAGYLRKALAQLGNFQGSVAEYSLGDALRLLAGLLRYQHDQFSSDDLDSLDETIGRVTCEEGLYEIPQRIRAVRSFRLRRGD